MRRLALVGASLALLGGMTTACGGSPDDASKDDFCEAYKKVGEADSWDDTQDAADKLKDVGTPEEIDGDARDGFEMVLDIVDDADSEDDADEAYDDLDSDDTKKFEAFGKKAQELCN